MRVHLLGTAAGGGVPQWNCACAVCRAARDGSARVEPRTQASAAITADGETWFLLHASPDVRQQIEAFPALWPRGARSSPLGGVLLSNGDLDACLGLFVLRESQPLSIHATSAVRRGLVEWNVIARTLDRTAGQTAWRDLAPDVEQPVLDASGRASGLWVTAVVVPGKVPLHLHGLVAASPEDTVALRLRDERTGQILVWAPSVAGPSPALEPLLREATCVLFDGTFWSSTELVEAAGGTRLAHEMGHWPLGGPDGSLELLARLSARRILVHINNTNPILVDGSPERAALRETGVTVGADGMEVLS